MQPRVVSITQSTEVGTFYTVDEIAALAEWAHGHGMLLHLDGARLANAAAALGVELGAFGAGAGVDVALLRRDQERRAWGPRPSSPSARTPRPRLPFIRKQSMQLASKMRFVAAQFVALLTDDLWLRNARHANAMARRLAGGAPTVPGVEVGLSGPGQRGVRRPTPGGRPSALQAEFPFYVWDEATGVVRWMASFDTTEADVDAVRRRDRPRRWTAPPLR